MTILTLFKLFAKLEEYILDKLLTLDEFSLVLRVSTRTIYRMLEDGELLFAIKIKGSWRFNENDIKVWLEQRKVGKNNIPLMQIESIIKHVSRAIPK